jgi:predicted acyltransferase (DUF342 family)
MAVAGSIDAKILRISTNAAVEGTLAAGGGVNVSGNATVAGNMSVAGSIDVRVLRISTNAAVEGTLAVGGNVNAIGNVNASAGSFTLKTETVLPGEGKINYTISGPVRRLTTVDAIINGNSIDIMRDISSLRGQGYNVIVTMKEA